MELQFTELKQKDVINIVNGANLGRVCDVTFSFPAGNVQGLTVTGGRGFRFTKKELFIPLCDVERVGEDAVLVKLSEGHPNPPPKPPQGCPPKNCPPPPKPPQSPCNRRSFDEYE